MVNDKFLIVSNRLPITVSKKDGHLTFTESNGGLATAMSSLDIASSDQVWIGWPGIGSDELTASEKNAVTRELKKRNCLPVYLTNDQVKNFYEGYSNDTLWPLFHYFQTLVQHNAEYWSAYQRVNALYLAAINKVAHPTSKIWIHDYHLMLLPGLTRQALPMATIGFFIHIPFPSYEIYRLLPERKELLEGLLGADLVGFHIYDYARHFLSSCLRVLGLSSNHGVINYMGRSIKVDAFPIGIDYRKYRSTLDLPSVQQEIANLHQHYAGQKIILSVDRLDYSKGIPQRLEAFELFLKENPRYLKKVKLIMIAMPSRTEIASYKNLRGTIEQTVSRINGTFGSTDWTPISYQFQNLGFEQITALYAASDIALITPLRDGMNLVAKEYVASKKDRPGVLILSEMAGALDELPEAISVNPASSRLIANALVKALRMPKLAQLVRLASMQQRLKSYSVQKWGQDFIEQLDAAHNMREQLSHKLLTATMLQDIQREFAQAQSRLLILDYDGTIQTFKNSPRASAAQPSARLLATLRTIASLPNTTLFIVSGRDKDTLESWFGNTRISLIAEHGAWTKYDGTWQEIDASFAREKAIILPILEQFTSRTAGAVIEVKDYVVTWHYRNVTPELAYVRVKDVRRALETALAGKHVGVYIGHKIIEIKPEAVHKGYATSELLKRYPSDFLLCAGDDYTDEDMFHQLPKTAVSIKVGDGSTAARYQVPTVEKMIEILESFVH